MAIELVTDLDQAKGRIAAGDKLVEVHYAPAEGDRQALARVPKEWLIERRDHAR